jgi:hypothetical protein
LLGIYANSCREEGINKIKKDPNYTGSFSLSISNINCSIAISNDATSSKKIITNASDGIYYEQLQFYVEISSLPYIVKNIK